LVEAFKSTLEVVGRADYLVHVVDGSSSDPDGEIDAVRTVLAEIDALEVPELLVFNKADLDPEQVAELVARHPGSVGVSARTGEGIEHFLRTLSDRLRAISTVVELLVPYERGDVLASVHREGEVVSTSPEESGTRVRARLSDASVGRLAPYLVLDGVDPIGGPARGPASTLDQTVNIDQDDDHERE
jgi:GTP-binding protein HflX